jgi:hypothetical protein
MLTVNLLAFNIDPEAKEKLGKFSRKVLLYCENVILLIIQKKTRERDELRQNTRKESSRYDST